jgi:hypothetical protein
MPHDPYKNHATAPSLGFEAVTLDVDIEPPPKGLYIGGTGAVVLMDAAGNEVTFANAQAGSILPVRPRQVVSVGTVATGIIVLK